jgi:hypothetical protein
MDPLLLRAIVQELSGRHDNAHAPERNDSVNTLLRKWCILINLGY